MRMPLYDPNAPKETVSLSLNSDLLAQARALGVDLDAHFTARLEQVLSWAKWQEENREAIEAHNRRVETFGLFTDHLRRFKETP
jgi:antitoxin CcdA